MICPCGPLLTNSHFHLLKMLVYDVISFCFTSWILFPAVFTLGTTVRPQGGTFAIIVSSRIRFLDPLHVLDSSLGAAPSLRFVYLSVFAF